MASNLQKIGLHVSAAGGVENAPERAKNEFNAECFQFFSRSPRGGGAPKITDDQIKLFRERCENYGFESYIHAPYYINFASKNKKIYHGSINAIREELTRGSLLGVKYVVTHLGSAREWVDEKISPPAGLPAEALAKAGGGEVRIGEPTPQAAGPEAKLFGALDQEITGLKEIFKDKPKYSSQLLLEIAAGAGSVVGDTFEELAYLLQGLDRDDVGICLDTCHLFASGYDIRTADAWSGTLKKFKKVIGLEKLKLIHANDSKAELGGRTDRHEHLGKGFIGEGGFKAMLNNPHLQHVNFILETKHDSQIHKDIEFLKKHRK